MYCTLIKKVNVTKSDKLTKISHNKLTNLIGIGGTNGFVQVVNLDITSQNQLTSKQTLESHSSEITLLRWNDQFNKLTTCDSSGVIIVWRLNNNVWETEMINNR